MKMEPVIEPTIEEQELKEHVTKTLANQGVLGKIKAQLRAAVFHAMRDHIDAKEDPLQENAKLNDFGQAGEMGFDIVMEFLDYFQWENALVVLQEEANAEHKTMASIQTALMYDKLGLNTKSMSFAAAPLLIQLLQHQLTQKDKTNVDQHTVHHRQELSFAVSKQPDRYELNYQRETVDVEKTLSTKMQNHDDEYNFAERETERGADKQQLDVPQHGSIANKTTEEEESDVESEELDESMAEILSGSELEQSDSRDQSMNSNNVKYAKDNEMPDAYEEESFASPPPVPSKLPTLPPLTSSLGATLAAQKHDDDEFDEELEAARLSSLDEKLKAMEAEDETGILQQLKASLQSELQRNDEGASSMKTDEEDEEGDAYGSDFEEEIASDISEEVEESMAELSTMEDDEHREQTESEAQALHVPMLHKDRAVDSEDALNNYDYIEEVERG